MTKFLDSEHKSGFVKSVRAMMQGKRGPWEILEQESSLSLALGSPQDCAMWALTTASLGSPRWTWLNVRQAVIQCMEHRPQHQPQTQLWAALGWGLGGQGWPHQQTTLTLSLSTSAYTEPYKVCPISAMTPRENLGSEEEQSSSEEEDGTLRDPSITNKVGVGSGSMVVRRKIRGEGNHLGLSSCEVSGAWKGMGGWSKAA